MLLVGLGSLFIHVSAIQQIKDDLNIFERGFVGCVLGATIALFLNLAIPLNEFAGTLLVLASLTGLILERSSLRRVFSEPPAWRFILFAVVALTVSAALHRNVFLYDTGLYHFPNILWHRESPWVFGLANLHGRFGFPSVWHDLSALFWLPFTGIRTAFAINGALLTLFLCGLLENTFSPKKSSLSPKLYALFLVLFIALFSDSVFIHLGSPGTDLPGALFTAFSFFIALDLAFEERWRPGRTLLLCFTVMAALTVKLSQAPLVLLPFLVFAGHWNKNRRSVLDFLKGQATGLLIFFGAIWLLRNLALSGCLVYPQASTCIAALPWSVPSADVVSEAAWIKSWARLPLAPPETVLGNWDWLRPWWKTFLKGRDTGRFFYLSLTLVPLAFITLGLQQQKDRVATRAHGFLLLASLAGLAFRFLQAPDFRFGYGFALALFACCATILATPLTKGLAEHPRTLQVVAALCTVILFNAAGGQRFTQIPIDGEWPVLPAAEFQIKKTTAGVDILTPTKGDQCWTAPRPCTPYFKETLTFGKWGPWVMIYDTRSKEN